jgi:hypothetical protein
MVARIIHEVFVQEEQMRRLLFYIMHMRVPDQSLFF